MAKIITIQGANQADELKRAACFEILNEQETTVLERLAKLSENPKAVSYLKSPILFGVLEGFLKNK